MLTQSQPIKHRAPVKEPKPPKGPKARECGNKACRAQFHPYSSMDSWCSPECGAVIALERVAKKKAKAARADRAETKKKLEQFKPLSYWEKLAEKHCNAYIRARDPDVCISCGVMHSSAWQAGHYKSVGSNTTLRYNEFNINKQCIKCNFDLSGNAIQYRIGLIAKYGIDKVEWLEQWHPTVKMTAEWAQEIAREYRAKLAQLKKERT